MTEESIQARVEVALEEYRASVCVRETNACLVLMKENGESHVMDLKGNSSQERRDFCFETGRLAKKLDMKPQVLLFLSEAWMVMRELADGETVDDYKDLAPSKDPNRIDVLIVSGETVDGRQNTHTEEIFSLKDGKRSTRPILVKGEAAVCPKPFFGSPISLLTPDAITQEAIKQDHSLTNAFWEGYRA